MGHNKSFSVSVNDDFEFDEACFRKFYKPLSNLPTPPFSTRNSSAAQSPRVPNEDVDRLNSELLAPAVHLTRMLPPGLSLETPSVPTVHAMLEQAQIPMDIIALAACILDALPSKFRNTWRLRFPRSRQGMTSKRHTLPAGPIQPPPCTDVVYPEVVILAALIIADKFVEDMQESTMYYASTWGRNLWSCEQINVTERCIMEALQYRIMPLWEPSCIKFARHDIELARRELLDENSELAHEARGYELQQTSTQSYPTGSGLTSVGLGLENTPVATPTHDVSISQLEQRLDEETRRTLSSVA